MSGADLVALLPLLLLAGTSILVMLAIAIHRRHGLILAMTLSSWSPL